MNEPNLGPKFARYTRLYESGVAYLPLAGLLCRGECGELTGAAITRFALYESLLKMEPTEAALMLRRAQPENKALTMDEMREMGGQPYYHVSLQGSGDKWGIMDDIIARHIQDYYYGERWLAYRRPPEKGE